MLTIFLAAVGVFVLGLGVALWWRAWRRLEERVRLLEDACCLLLQERVQELLARLMEIPRQGGEEE